MKMDNTLNFLKENFTFITGWVVGGGSLLGYFSEKNKRKLEEAQLGTDALKTMQDAYDKFTADSLRRYQELSFEITNLKSKLTNVTSELELEKYKYTKLKNSYENLKKEFDNHKKRL